MKVLVTGGTGFVGARITADLLRAGHAVRLLVRRPEQVAISLAPYGVAVTDVQVGDVLDRDAVKRAVDGCESVVHAAAVYSLDPRRAEEVLSTNERAAEMVLGTAVEQGLDPVVHISSTVALTRRGRSGPDLPLGDMTTPYARSKVASEVVARRLQEEGAPVVTVYPGGVLGPHDPYRGDQSERLRWQLLGRMTVWPPGGTHVVHVKTVSEVVLAVLEPGAGPRRYVVPGHHGTGEAIFTALRDVTGRRLPYLTVPPWALRPMVRGIEVVQRRLPRRFHIPTELEGVEISLCDTRMDDTAARVELGVHPPSLEETVRDTVVWLVGSGRLPAKYAAKALASQA